VGGGGGGRGFGETTKFVEKPWGGFGWGISLLKNRTSILISERNSHFSPHVKEK